MRWKLKGRLVYTRETSTVEVGIVNIGYKVLQDIEMIGNVTLKNGLKIYDKSHYEVMYYIHCKLQM